MGPLQAHIDSSQGDSPAGLAEEPRRFPFGTPCESDDTAGRHEPQILIEQIVPRDTYDAWQEQREAEREREREARPQIRWVHRQRGENGRAISARRL